jgi:hypothetical protein
VPNRPVPSPFGPVLDQPSRAGPSEIDFNPTYTDCRWSCVLYWLVWSRADLYTAAFAPAAGGLGGYGLRKHAMAEVQNGNEVSG